MFQTHCAIGRCVPAVGRLLLLRRLHFFLLFQLLQNKSMDDQHQFFLIENVNSLTIFFWFIHNSVKKMEKRRYFPRFMGESGKSSNGVSFHRDAAQRERAAASRPQQPRSASFAPLPPLYLLDKNPFSMTRIAHFLTYTHKHCLSTLKPRV